MYVYPAWQTVTVPATGWQTIDLTGAPFSVPTNAQFALLRVFNSRLADFRKPGGTEIFGSRKPGGSVGEFHVDAVVPLTSGTFEINASTLVGLEVYLVAYFAASDGLAFADYEDKTPAGTDPLTQGTWVTIDVSATVPSTAKWAVCSLRGTPSFNFGIRKNGAAEFVTAPTASGRIGSTFFLAPLSALGRFDVYGGVSATADAELQVHGYLTGGEHNDSVTSVGRVDLLENTGWVAQTSALSGQMAVYTFVGYDDSVITSAGWRISGATEDVYHPTTAGFTLGLVPITPAGAWEGKNTYNATGDNTLYGYLLGVIDSVQLASESAVISDTLEQDLYTPRTAGSEDGVQEAAAASDFATYDREAPIAETAGIADTATVDRDPIPSAESAAAADAVAADITQARTAAESAAISDAATAEHIAAGTAGEAGTTGISVAGEGEGAFGGVGAGSGAVGVGGAGTGIAGAAGAGGGAAGLSVDGEGLHGGAADGEGQVSVSASGEGFAVPPVETTPAGEAYQTFAMNLATGAVTYHSTQFNSRCSIGGKLYAAGPDGIHLIEGATDNGTPIEIDIAKYDMDLGSRLNKQVVDCFFALASGGDFDVSVSSENGSGTVVMTDGIPRAHGARPQDGVPLGVFGSRLGVSLRNRGGAELIELTEIELLVAVSSTRKAWQVRV